MLHHRKQSKQFLLTIPKQHSRKLKTRSECSGWWSYYTFTDCEGNTRHKAGTLVTIAGPEANADETRADDSVAADESVLVTINTQPATQAVAVGDPLSLAVDAIATPPGDASVLTLSGKPLLTIAGQTSVLINPPMMLILMLWRMLVLIESSSPLPMVLQKSSPLPLW